MARELNDDCVILPIILTQDAAQVDGNGRKSLTPMYATFGTIRAEQRNEVSSALQSGDGGKEGRRMGLHGVHLALCEARAVQS